MPPSIHRHRLRHNAIPVLAAGVALAATSLAWSQSPDESRINGLVDLLAAPVFADRERATEQLEVFPGELEPLIRKRLATSELTPEQIIRLETVLSDRFIDAPRAALGVGFTAPGRVNNQVQQVPVILDKVLAGFPCSATLRPGDIIRVVDGYKLPPTGGGDRVRTTIISHLPGEELELLIERDGRPSFVRVPLGDYSRLNNPPPPPAMVKAAWSIRKARLGLNAPDTYPPLRCVVDGARSSLGNLPVRKAPELGAGGSPDNGAALFHLLRSRASAPNQRNIAATNNARVVVRQPNPRIGVRVQRAPVAQDTTPKANRTRLQGQLDQAINDRQRYLRIVTRDDIAQEQLQAAVTALTEIEARIALIKSSIKQLDNPKPAAPQD